ncbi:MAG: phosphoribosylamine--glycine ligase [Flavobacteriales bacterium]|nr:phosphoribosylamine--glycine ligase [Flavobacteriales bacterium]
MNVLILGSGGREHAIAWKISQSEILEKLFVAPGNYGTSTIATNIDIDLIDYKKIKNTIIENKIHLLVIGPELPLVNGLHDQLSNDNDIKDLIIIGPKKEGALLEGSKTFAKKFMKNYKIPTAKYKSFTINEASEAKNYLSTLNPPYVIKADGLAAGKGVFICKNIHEAQNAINSIFFESKFGESGKKIVIEEFLSGIELSVFILTDGHSYKILPVAKDYKRIGNGDTGLNTGGMGAVSPVTFANNFFLKKVEKKIIYPTLEGLKKENIEYKGFIFFGLISVDGDPFVIEYNARLGDPETQVIMPRINSDLLKLLYSMKSKSEFKQQTIDISKLRASTIILSSGGYPEKYEKGYIINGIDLINDSIVFHAGSKITKDGQIVTNGGRVLAITSLNDKHEEAIKIGYKNVKKIKFKDCYYRQDIGKDLIK